jgi:hypothetical protein
MTAECTIKVKTPAELIAALPYLIGFHPADSVAVVALRGRQIVFAARYDLPDPGRSAEAIGRDAADVAQVVASQGVTTATVIGYGTFDRVTPTVVRLAAALELAGVPVFDQLRVTGGRWWSYLCVDQLCCPEEGKPCLPPDSAIAAAATFSGAVALPDRAALVAQLAPTGTVSSAGAQERLGELFDRETHEAGFHRQLRRAGRSAIRDAERRYRSGRRLTDAEVAWLGVLLVWLPVRDYAWERTGESSWWISLWTDVLRRVEPLYVPAPAALLGFAAWRSGQGALARVAIERAVDQEPEYEMARLLLEFLQLGVHPGVVEGWPEIASRGKAGPSKPTSGETPSGPAARETPSVPGAGETPPARPRPWRVDLPVPGRAVVDERLGRVRPRRPKRRGPRRRAL